MHCRQPERLKNFASFIHNSAPDQATRNTVATAMVLALAQVAGPSMMRRPPGFVFINASGLASDPIDDVAKQLTGLSMMEPSSNAEVVEKQRKWMIYLISSANHAQPRNHLESKDQHLHSLQFREVSRQVFGPPRAGFYASRHDPEMGWVSDKTNHIILRISRHEDRARFREDVLKRPLSLRRASGYGDSMKHEPKDLSVAGSLTDSEWDNELTTSAIDNSLPLLFLPHIQDLPLTGLDTSGLDMLAFCLEAESQSHKHQPSSAPEECIKQEWLIRWMNRLRKSLQVCPADYEFYVLKTVRELSEWCARLACILAMDGSSTEQRDSLAWDLYAMSLQCICLSIETLGWHGYGLKVEHPQQKIAKLLSIIREDGSISKRSILLKAQWLRAGSRDMILRQLEEVGLIHLESKEVTAVAAKAYFSRVAAQTQADPPPLLWEKCFGGKGDKAA